MVVWHLRGAQEDRPQVAARRVKEAWPVTLDGAVLQDGEPEPISVEAQAGLEITNDHDRMMDGDRDAQTATIRISGGACGLLLVGVHADLGSFVAAGARVAR